MPCPPFTVAFYDPIISAGDTKGRTRASMLAYSDDELEGIHNFIQYLFPLPEQSMFNMSAPVITKEVRNAFLARSELRDALRESLARMLKFYGFQGKMTANGSFQISADEAKFNKKSSATWRTRMDHNHLRISRIIRCLRILGLEDEARAFLAALREHDAPRKVGARSYMYWERAAQRPLHLPPDEDDEDAEGVGWLREEPLGAKEVKEKGDEENV